MREGSPGAERVRVRGRSDPRGRYWVGVLSAGAQDSGSLRNQAVLFLRSKITPNTRTARAPATARIIRDPPMAYSFPGMRRSQGSQFPRKKSDYADFDFLLRRMMTPTTT